MHPTFLATESRALIIFRPRPLDWWAFEMQISSTWPTDARFQILLPLVRVDGKVKYVQFLFDDDGAGANDAALMLYDEVVVRSFALRVHLIVALVEFFFCLVACPCEVVEACEEAFCVVLFLERADGVAGGEGGGYVLRDEGCGEEGHVCLKP